MQQAELKEFFRELDHTAPSFVREKFATNGYPVPRRKYVKQWIDAQDAKAKSRHDAIVRRCQITVCCVGLSGFVAMFYLNFVR